MKQDRLLLHPILTALLVGAVSGAILLLSVSPVVRTVSGTIVALIIPGYLTIMCLWPGEEGPDRIWKWTLVIPTGIALVGGLLILVNYFWIYRYERLLMIILFVNVALVAGAWLRYRKNGFQGGGSQIKRVVKALPCRFRYPGLKLFFELAIMMLVASLLYAVIIPEQPNHITEFYMLTSQGYVPVSLNKDEVEHELILGITNREGFPAAFRVVIFGESSSSTAIIWADSIMVGVGETVEKTVHFKSTDHKVDRIKISMYLNINAEPYRTLQLDYK